MDASDNIAGTRCKVLDSAVALFSEKGYKGASIREIIEHAGVTRPVLYYYFKNKEDLFCSLVESSFAELSEDFDEIMSVAISCRSRLKLLMSKTFARAEESPGMVRLLLNAVFSSPGEEVRLDMTELVEQRFSRVTAIMQAGLDAGELCGSDAESLALVFMGVMDTHIMAKIHRPQLVLTAKLADFLVDLFIKGAGGANGKRTYADTREKRADWVAEK